MPELDAPAMVTFRWGPMEASIVADLYRAWEAGDRAIVGEEGIRNGATIWRAIRTAFNARGRRNGEVPLEGVLELPPRVVDLFVRAVETALYGQGRPIDSGRAVAVLDWLQQALDRATAPSESAPKATR
jgi:hypothetical protein